MAKKMFKKGTRVMKVEYVYRYLGDASSKLKGQPGKKVWRRCVSEKNSK